MHGHLLAVTRLVMWKLKRMEDALTRSVGPIRAEFALEHALGGWSSQGHSLLDNQR